jgi:hypothetical protein
MRHGDAGVGSLRALRPRVEHGADVGTTHLSAAARASMDDCLAAMAVVMAASESASFRELCSIAVFCVARVRSAFCVPEPHTPPPRVSDAAQWVSARGTDGALQPCGKPAQPTSLLHRSAYSAQPWGIDSGDCQVGLVGARKRAGRNDMRGDDGSSPGTRTPPAPGRSTTARITQPRRTRSVRLRGAAGPKTTRSAFRGAQRRGRETG